jgi:hypothetical protein
MAENKPVRDMKLPISTIRPTRLIASPKGIVAERANKVDTMLSTKSIILSLPERPMKVCVSCLRSVVADSTE